MHRFHLIIAMLVHSIWSYGQASDDSLTLDFIPIFQAKTLLLSDESECDTFPCISVFKVYLSDFELLKDDEVVWEESESFRLIDAAQPSSLTIDLEYKKDLNFDALRFHIGIDSLTSVSGAFGGDLDPTKGMYWTWNSGYIHFKIEGMAKEAPARDFEFHLGGYQGPHAVYEEVLLSLAAEDIQEIRIDLDAWFARLNLEKEHLIMSPGAEAKKIAKLLPSIFKVYAKE